MTTTPLPPPTVTALVQAYGRRQGRLRLLAAVALAVALAAWLVLLAMVADRLVELPGGVRLLGPVLALLAPLAAVVAGLLAWWRPPPAERLAAELDAALPGSRDALRSTLNFATREAAAPGGLNGALVAASGRAAVAVAARLSPQDLLSPRAVAWRLGAALAGMVVLGAAIASAWLPWPLMWVRFTQPLGNHPRPSWTMIAVQAPLVQELAEGDDLAVAVQVGGRFPADGRAALLATRPGGEQRLQLSPLPGQRFQAQVAAVAAPFSYVIVAGDGRSARYRVEVLPRPRLELVTARYDYPRYTRLPRRTEELSYRELTGVPGTRVRLELTSSVAVREGWLQFPNRRYPLSLDRERRHATFSFSVEEEDTTFTVHLVGENGIPNRGEAPFRVRVLPDNLPTVTVRGLPEPPTLFREDLLHLTYAASDDFGLAELFLRAWPASGRDPKFYSIPLERSVMKQAEGGVTVKVAEFAEEDDAILGLELVAVDTRGQESATPRQEVAIIAETPDRQLAELIRIHTEFLAQGHRSRLRDNARVLTAQAGALGILLDGMDATTKLEGPRREMLQRVQAQLRGVDMWGGLDPWLIWVTEYPYYSQRQAEYAMCLAWVLRTNAWFGPRVAALLEASTPVLPAVQDLHREVAAEAELAALLLAANEGALQEHRLRLMSYLAEKAWLLLLAPDGLDPALRERLEQQRREHMQAILALGEAGQDEALAALLAPLREVAALQQPEEARLLGVLATLRETLATGPWLDGHLAAPLQRLRREWSWARLLRQALAHGTEDRLLLALQDAVRLRQDTPVAEDGELLLVTRAHAALTTGDRDRVTAAAAAIERLTPWAERHDLVARLRLLRLWLHELRLDVAVGREAPEQPDCERAWQDVRELYLATVAEMAAGRWAELEPAALAALRGLGQHASLFRPWTARLAWAQPEFAAQAAAVDQALAELVTALEPAVAAGLAAALAEWPPLVADVQASLDRELPRLGAEQAALRAEMVAGAAAIAAVSEVERKDSKWFWRDAPRERHEYAARLVARCRTWFLAVDRVVSLQEEAWLAAPAQPREALLALGRLGDQLDALEEEIHDGTWGAMMNRPGGQYPNWMGPIADYYGRFQTELGPDLRRWFGLAAGPPGELMRDEAFAAASAKRAAAPKYAAWVQALEEFATWQAFAAGDPAPAARQARLQALAEHELRAVYWDRVVLAVASLQESVTGAVPASRAASFTGIPDTALARARVAREYLRGVLLPAAAGPEAAALHQALNDWDYYAPRVTTAALAAAAEGARAQLGEELSEWLGRLEAARRGLGELLRVAPPQLKARRRWTDIQRYDTLTTAGRLVRGEMRWTERVAEAERWSWSQRAQWLAPGAAAPTWAELAWVTGLVQRCRRQSASVIRRQNQGLGAEPESPGELLLKMPRHLYDELVRAASQPYPTQFKEPGRSYIKVLQQEAR